MRKYVDSAYVRGITGHRELVELYLITVHIGGQRFRPVRKLFWAGMYSTS